MIRWSIQEALRIPEEIPKMLDSDNSRKKCVQDERLQQLMERYQQGHMEAFDQLHANLSPILLRYLRRRCFDPERAQDLLQETFLQIHRSRKTYQPGRKVEPWVYAIARFVYLMDERARGRRRRLMAATARETPPDAGAVPARAERVPDRLFLSHHVDRLTPIKREPLLLHHVWGFSFAEIARALGVTEGAAKVRAHRGLKELRKLALIEP